jgi:CheY-like chemotaxis protein
MRSQEGGFGDVAMARVLLADDDEMVLATVLAMLQPHHEVTGVRGFEALDRIREDDYDLLIIDVCMPDVSVWKMIRALREEGCELPIVA